MKHGLKQSIIGGILFGIAVFLVRCSSYELDADAVMKEVPLSVLAAGFVKQGRTPPTIEWEDGRARFGFVHTAIAVRVYSVTETHDQERIVATLRAAAEKRQLLPLNVTFFDRDHQTNETTSPQIIRVVEISRLEGE